MTTITEKNPKLKALVEKFEKDHQTFCNAMVQVAYRLTKEAAQIGNLLLDMQKEGKFKTKRRLWTWLELEVNYEIPKTTFYRYINAAEWWKQAEIVSGKEALTDVASLKALKLLASPKVEFDPIDDGWTKKGSNYTRTIQGVHAEVRCEEGKKPYVWINGKCHCATGGLREAITIAEELVRKKPPRSLEQIGHDGWTESKGVFSKGNVSIKFVDGEWDVTPDGDEEQTAAFPDLESGKAYGETLQYPNGKPAAPPPAAEPEPPKLEWIDCHYGEHRDKSGRYHIDSGGDNPELPWTLIGPEDKSRETARVYRTLELAKLAAQASVERSQTGQPNPTGPNVLLYDDDETAEPEVKILPNGKPTAKTIKLFPGQGQEPPDTHEAEDQEEPEYDAPELYWLECGKDGEPRKKREHTHCYRARTGPLADDFLPYKIEHKPSRYEAHKNEPWLLTMPVGSQRFASLHEAQAAAQEQHDEQDDAPEPPAEKPAVLKNAVADLPGFVKVLTLDECKRLLVLVQARIDSAAAEDQAPSVDGWTKGDWDKENHWSKHTNGGWTILHTKGCRWELYDPKGQFIEAFRTGVGAKQAALDYYQQGQAAAQEPPDEKPVAWSNLTDADANEAVAEGTCVVFFTAVGCGPCRDIRPTLVALAKENKATTFAEAAADDCLEFFGKHKVARVPELILFKHGKEVRRLKGFYSLEQLRAWLVEFGAVEEPPAEKPEDLTHPGFPTLTEDVYPPAESLMDEARKLQRLKKEGKTIPQLADEYAPPGLQRPQEYIRNRLKLLKLVVLKPETEALLNGGKITLEEGCTAVDTLDAGNSWDVPNVVEGESRTVNQ
jgi:thiol-disulfide isomerase/thioredoxin